MSLFATKLVDEYGGTTYNLTGLGYGALVALMLLLLILACYVTGGKTRFKTKHLVFAAAAMALAMITSFLKLFEAPMGGSVTLFSMLFICCIGYWYGLRTGIMTGVAYGLLQLISDPYIISLPQMITDYLLAFGALGLSGIFCNKKERTHQGLHCGRLGPLLLCLPVRPDFLRHVRRRNRHERPGLFPGLQRLLSGLRGGHYADCTGDSGGK